MPVPPSPFESPRLDLLGLPVDALDSGDLIPAVAALVERGRSETGRRISYLNVHVANEAHRHPDLAHFLRSVDLCYCDGEGIRLGMRLLGGELPCRMTGADWIWDLAERAAGHWRIFWLGGEPGVTDAACRILRERHPELVCASDHGFHSADDTPALLERIDAFEPDILLVGMGTPIQERWVAKNADALRVPVIWCLGATADFVSGQVDRGPEWLHENQEWLARLLVDPKRLWRRYLIGNTGFLLRVLGSRLKGTRKS